MRLLTMLALMSAAYLVCHVLRVMTDARHRKVGGIHFVRVGRLQTSFCIARRR